MGEVNKKRRRSWGIGLAVFGWATIIFTSSQFADDRIKVAIDLFGATVAAFGIWIAFRKQLCVLFN
jgi:hypothetical protein